MPITTTDRSHVKARVFVLTSGTRAIIVSKSKDERSAPWVVWEEQPDTTITHAFFRSRPRSRHIETHLGQALCTKSYVGGKHDALAFADDLLTR